MTEEHVSDKLEKIDIPVVLRENITALVITGLSDSKRNLFIVYYILSDGKIFLKENKTEIGLRFIEVKKGNIICIWKRREKGCEEFCGFFDKNGNNLMNNENDFTIPDQLHNRIQQWYNTRFPSNRRRSTSE
jgi:hypothetical protein